MAHKICIISSLHLSTNPRVWKEANCLAEAGYKVVILTNWVTEESKKKDLSFVRHANISYKASLNLIPGETGDLQRFYHRARVKFSRILKKFTGFESAWLLGFAPGLMFTNALAEEADLYIAHTEFGLAVGNELLAAGKKVAFDMEDWYSRDYLVPERPVKLLQKLEKTALENGSYCTCPSRAMAEGLQKANPSAKTIQVIYNGFSIQENATKFNAISKNPSCIWFSQTIGQGRGLETAINAFQYLDEKTELHLVGKCVPGYDEELKKIFPFSKGHVLFIHPPVKHTELIPLLAKHTVGLAIEKTYPESRNKTITNKILQYVQAGIRVLATDTDGQREVAAFFKDIVALVPEGDTKIWASNLSVLIKSGDIDFQEQRTKFNEVFSWEAQEKKLLSLVSSSLKV